MSSAGAVLGLVGCDVPGEPLGVEGATLLEIRAELPFETARQPDGATGGPRVPLARAVADEVHAVSSWLQANAVRIELLATDVGFAELLPAVPSFSARPSRMLKPNT